MLKVQWVSGFLWETLFISYLELSQGWTHEPRVNTWPNADPSQHFLTPRHRHVSPSNQSQSWIFWWNLRNPEALCLLDACQELLTVILPPWEKTFLKMEPSQTGEQRDGDTARARDLVWSLDPAMPESNVSLHLETVSFVCKNTGKPNQQIVHSNYCCDKWRGEINLKGLNFRILWQSNWVRHFHSSTMHMPCSLGPYTLFYQATPI